MQTLFPDQAEIMTALRLAMRKYKAILLQSPTGSGKTRMAVDMILGFLSKKHTGRMLMGFPRIALMDQTSKTLTSLGISHTFIANGYPYNPFAQVIIGMEDTIANWIRAGKMPRDIFVFIPDEVHYGDRSLDVNINFFKACGAWVIGLSATPWKMSGQGLGIWFEYMVKGKSIRWLIDNKRLSEYQLFGGRKYQQRDYTSEADVIAAMEANNEIVGDCVNEYKLHSMGKIWVTRCTSVKTSEDTAQKFREAGVPTAHVDGDTPSDERTRIFKALARRELFNVTFVDLLNFGFDLAQAAGMDVCIEGGSDLKPSESLAGQLQFWGRLIRYKPFPARINDHVNNHRKHGAPDAEREWTLDSLTKKQRGEKVTPSKLCGECLFVHPPAPQCPDCGHVYEIESREIREVKGKLEEVKFSEEVKAEKGEYDPRNDGFAGILPPVDNAEELQSLINFATRKQIENPIAWATEEFRKKCLTLTE